MNEKIKELKHLATTYRDQGAGEIREFDEDKFAELIVRECALVVFKNTGPKSALYVLDHFGIKEEE